MNFNKEIIVLQHKDNKKFLNVDLGITFPTPYEATDVGKFSIIELYETISNLDDFEAVVFDVEYTESNNGSENEEELFLIWSINFNAYWKQNGTGYTTDKNIIGKYTYNQAIDICINSISKNGFVNQAMIPANVLKNL